MNYHYTPWYKASQDFDRRGVDAQYRPSEEMGTSFTGKSCVRSSRKAAITVSCKRARQKIHHP